MDKKIVPPREERWEKIGKPKPPKMGGINPTTVNAPPVDDLLDQLDKIVPKKDCTHNCNCDPCSRGNCAGCLVDALRNADHAVIREAVKKYRVNIYE